MGDACRDAETSYEPSACISLALDPVSSPDESELEGDGGEIASGKVAGGGDGKGAGGAILFFRTPFGICGL